MKKHHKISSARWTELQNQKGKESSASTHFAPESNADQIAWLRAYANYFDIKDERTLPSPCRFEVLSSFKFLILILT